ncbi:MAG: cupin domain-containing protein [Balneolaceae bacterium]
MSEPYKVIKCKNYQWNSIEKKTYKFDPDSFRDIHRYSLLTNEYKDLNFHTRYFEIQPGGYSSLEYHRHPHSVVVIRGRGTVILENDLVDLSLYDVVFIAPDTIHQFHAAKEEKLGFLCMVDRYRDKPKIPDSNLLRERITNPAVLEKIRR